MNGKNVLVMDHNIETARNTAFLLGLAGYQVRTVTDTLAALNWIATTRLNQNRIDLILVSNCPSEQDAYGVIAHVHDQDLAIPVLLIRRNSPFDRGRMTAWPKAAVYFSPPEEMLAKVRSFI